MKYFLLAGEASGDLHAANLIKQLRNLDADAEFMGLGGDRMVAAGAHLYRHYRHMAFMGFVAVLANLDKVRENFRIAREALLSEQPDVLILVDYPSFNLKMAAFCRKHLPHTRIVYYIPPKIWAWKSWRVHRIAQLSDAVLGIFPFEPAFYNKYGYTCAYVGNPTVDSVRDWQQTHPLLSREQDMIALLPGSRISEVRHCLPTMLEAARRIPGYRIRVAKAPGLTADVYAPYLHEDECLVEDAYSLMATARVAVVNSGTATLETALMRCPQVAVYYIACSPIVKHIWRALFTIHHFTLVNIIAARSNNPELTAQIRPNPGEGIIREMIAYLFTPNNIEQELRRLLSDATYTKQMLHHYDLIHSVLGDTPAAVNAAKTITNLIMPNRAKQI